MTRHSSLSVSPDLSTPLHLFTSHVSFLSSFICLPVAQHSIAPARHHFNSLSSPLSTPSSFFPDPSPWINLPPQSVYLSLKPSYPSHSPTHPPCYFAVASERNRKYYPTKLATFTPAFVWLQVSVLPVVLTPTFD